MDAARVAPPFPDGYPIAMPFDAIVSPSMVVKMLVVVPVKIPFSIFPVLVERTYASLSSILPVPWAVTSVFPSGSTLHPIFFPLNSPISFPSVFSPTITFFGCGSVLVIALLGSSDVLQLGQIVS